MDIHFKNKTAIVTGGASGIGEACAITLAAAGATVIVADLKKADAQKTVDTITKAGGKAHACAADVADDSAVKAMVDFAVKETGGLHLLVNNAGIGGPQKPTGEYAVDDWQKVIAINLTGVFLGLRYGIPAIEKAGGGAIVNMASILGSVGIAQSCAYVAAKHGVVGLTKSAALEYSAKGIRINAVGPGFIATPLLDNISNEMRDGLVALHPIGRLGTSQEVADLVCFLLSDRASFITGSYHLVDGAYTAQ